MIETDQQTETEREREIERERGWRKEGHKKVSLEQWVA